MNTTSLLSVGSMTIGAALLLNGCAEPSHTTSPYHPGPVVGRAVGTGVGVVGGNVAAMGVGAVEGTVSGFAAPFDTTTRTVRHWRTETTPDGRTIQVPVDILVDAYGRPVNMQPISNTAETTVRPARPK